VDSHHNSRFQERHSLAPRPGLACPVDIPKLVGAGRIWHSKEPVEKCSLSDVSAADAMTRHADRAYPQ